MTKVSVIIPAYNVEQYIKRCIASVMAQSLREIEIIIINDGSTDKTLSLIQECAKLDSRIVVVDQANLGIGAARKRGLELASGEYIHFIDADDWIEPNMMSELYAYAISYDADIVEANGYYQDEPDGKRIGATGYKCRKEVTIMDPTAVAKGILQRTQSCSLCCRLIRRDLCVRNSVTFVEGVNFGEDAHFICRLCKYSPKYIYVDKKYYHATNNPTSTTKTRFTKDKFNCRIWWITDLEKILDADEYMQALTTMKFFVKEEAAQSGLYSFEEFNSIFPEVGDNIAYVKANVVRKHLMYISIARHNFAFIRSGSKGLLNIASRFIDKLVRVRRI